MRSGTFHHKMSSGMMKFRIGYGYDVHALGEGLPLILGGVEIEHAKGCIAHSDGDVVLHAISDALLGAAALGDIGLHFPDTSDEFKGADSKLLLARCVELLREKGYAVGNVDCTISMQRPKLRPHIDRMRETIAARSESTPTRFPSKRPRLSGSVSKGAKRAFPSRRSP